MSCPHCGCKELATLRTLELKWCPECRRYLPWALTEGQKPLIGAARQLNSVSEQKT